MPDDLPDPVVLVLTHLAPLAVSPLHIGTRRAEGDPLPYLLVGLILAEDDPVIGVGTADVSVHHMAAAAGGVDAETLAWRGGLVAHRRMALLARDTGTPITVSGRRYCVDSLDTVERPALRDYDDDLIRRTKAVYRLGLSHVPV